MMSEEEGKRNVREREVGKIVYLFVLKSSILIKNLRYRGDCVSITVSAKRNKFVNFDF